MLKLRQSPNPVKTAAWSATFRNIPHVKGQ